jgi:hypothetical protein
MRNSFRVLIVAQIGEKVRGFSEPSEGEAANQSSVLSLQLSVFSRQFRTCQSELVVRSHYTDGLPGSY